MRGAKLAIAAALAADEAVSALVPAAQVFAVERATVTTERQDTGPMVRHELSVEVTVSNPTEDAADAALDAIVRAVRARLSASEDSTRPIFALAKR